MSTPQRKEDRGVQVTPRTSTGIDACTVMDRAPRASPACEETAGTSIFAAANVTRFQVNDADELGDMLVDWNVEMKQLCGGSFKGDLLVVPLGPVLILRGYFNQPMLQRTGVPDGCITISQPRRDSDPYVHCGHEVEDGEVFVCSNGAEGTSVNRGVHVPTTISLHLEFLHSQAQWLSDPLSAPRGTIKLHAPGKEWTAGFHQAVAWLLDALEQYPQAFARADVRGSLIDVLLARINTLAAASAPITDDREMRASRRRAVLRAREYVDTHLAEPIRLSDLCEHACTQSRALEYGFREVMGMSPVAYVRTMRLHRARRLLRSTVVRTRSVSEIAMDCGFWHLSQFAVDYKKFFGESPSITYKRTQSLLPQRDRRSQSRLDDQRCIA